MRESPTDGNHKAAPSWRTDGWWPELRLAFIQENARVVAHLDV